MAEELLGTGDLSAPAAAAEAAKSAFESEGSPIHVDSAVPTPTPNLSPEDLSVATEPSTEANLPGSDFWDEDKTALAEPSESQETPVAPEVQAAQERAIAEAIKYKANGVDAEISIDDARKILSQYDGNQKGYKLASQAQKQLKQLQKELADLTPVRERLAELDSLKGDPSGLIEAVTGESMATLIQKEVEKHNTYQLATPEERAQMDYLVKQQELEARVAKQEKQLNERESQLAAEAAEGRKEVLNEKLKSAMSEYYQPNEDLVVDNDLREMVWRTSVAKVKKYHAEGYPLSDKLINAVFRKTSKSLGTHRTANVDKEVSKISAQNSAQAVEKAQLASQQNYAPSKVPSTKGMNPLELFESLVKGKRA